MGKRAIKLAENTPPAPPPPPIDAEEPEALRGFELAPPEAAAGPLVLSPDRFWPGAEHYRSQATEADATLFYLYRLIPVIKRSPAYIDKRVTLSAEQIRDDWGSGTYKVIFIDNNRRGRNKEVFSTVIEINDPQREPVIHDYRELDQTSRKNQPFILSLKRQGVLDNEGNVVMPNTEPAAAKGETAEILKAAFSALEKSRSNPNDQLAQLKLLVDMMKPVDRPLISDQAMTMLAPLAKLLLSRLLDPPAAPPAPPPAAPQDPLQALTVLRSAREFLGEMGDPAGRSPGLGEMVAAALPGVVQAALEYLRERDARTAAIQTTAAGGAPAAIAQAANPHQEHQVTIQNILSLGRLALRNFLQGLDGEDFANGLLIGNPDGEQLLLELQALGTEKIIGALQASPYWPQVAARAMEVRTFIDEVVNFKGEPDPEPPPHA